MASRVLVDTSALLAVAHPRDQYHAQAQAIGRRHVHGGGRFVGSMLVLAELQGHLLFRRGPAVARRVIAAMLSDPAYEWVDCTGDLVRSAVSAWLERFGDQEFTLADAVNFELMRRLRLRAAFAFDVHFATAGFETLH